MLFFFFGLCVVVILAVWHLFGHVTSNVEQAEYTVIRQARDYEIRRYPSRIVAETKIPGSGTKALNEGFRVVAGYIFGDNTKREKIAMTAPVLASTEKVATTKAAEGETVVSFGMPKSKELSQLPFPVDPRVMVMTQPETVYAVKRFGGYRSDAAIKRAEARLLEALRRDGVKMLGVPVYAGYNAPGTPPWLMRHEVMIPIEAESF